MTEQTEARTERAEHVGPVRLSAELSAGVIEVNAAHTDTAEVRLESINPGDEVAADLIARTRIETVGDRFTVRVPSPANVSGGRTHQGIQAAAGYGNVVVAGNIFGNVQVGGNMYVGDGGVRVGGSVSGAVFGGAVRMAVTVPSGSDVSGRTVSADMRVIADPLRVYADHQEAAADPEAATRTFVGKAEFKSTSGDLDTVGVHKVEATTIGGDVTTDGAKAMKVSTTSGDVRAESLAGDLFVRTVSGDIRAEAKVNCSVHAESVSGDVTVYRDHGLTVNVSARSVSGRVRT